MRNGPGWGQETLEYESRGSTGSLSRASTPQDALMNSPERFSAYEAFQGFKTKAQTTQRERPFATETATAQLEVRFSAES